MACTDSMDRGSLGQVEQVHGDLYAADPSVRPWWNLHNTAAPPFSRPSISVAVHKGRARSKSDIAATRAISRTPSRLPGSAPTPGAWKSMSSRGVLPPAVAPAVELHHPLSPDGQVVRQRRGVPRTHPSRGTVQQDHRDHRGPQPGIGLHRPGEGVGLAHEFTHRDSTLRPWMCHRHHSGHWRLSPLMAWAELWNGGRADDDGRQAAPRA